MDLGLPRSLASYSLAPYFSGLLDDVGGAAAAYSLRKLSKTSPVNALRIRRSSDNVEVNVQFDHSNVVSTDSPITNVTEPTSLDLGTSWVVATGSASSTTLSPLSSLAVSGASSGFQVRVPINQPPIPSGNTVTIGTVVTSVTGSWSIFLADAGGSPSSSIAEMASTTSLTTTNANSAYIYIRSNDAAGAIQLGFGFGASYTVGDTTDTNLGDFISGTNAFVVTWYDQSGSGNNASQDTLNEQPKIADSSSGLITDPNGRTTISFDGSNDDLDLPDVITSINSASAFNVCQNIGYSAGTEIGLALSRLSGGNRRWYLPARTTNGWHFSYGPDFGSSSVRLVDAADTDEAQHLFSGVAGSSTAKGYFDGVEKISVSSVDTYLSQTAGGIGSHNGGSNWGGNISEVVIYASDQTASLSDIHDNIKTYYDIS